MTGSTVNVDRREEKGAALIIALLTVALLLAMAMGISLTAISELGVTRTYETQTTALQAAEAGLNHAASLVANYTGPDFTSLLALRPEPLSNEYMTGNNPFIAANAAQFAPGALMIVDTTAKGFPLVDGVSGAPVQDTYYRVSLIDDEPTTSTGLPRIPNFVPGATYRELLLPDAGDPRVDKNNRMVIYSTGSYANASVTLEGWIAFLPFPALSANDDITVSGNMLVSGLYGGIHSNEDLVIAQGGGDNWQVEQTFTSAGSILPTATAAEGHVGGFYGGGQDRLDLPEFVTTDPISGGSPTNPRLQDFLIRRATRILIDPSFADGAHATDPNDTTGDVNGNKATRRLSSLAERLGIDYGTLASQLDSDSSAVKVQQTSDAAVEIIRATPGGAASAVTKMVVADTGWAYSGGTNASWGILTNNNGMLAGGQTYYVVGQDNFSSGVANGGNVSLTGNVGSNGAPLNVTIMATGSITISGTPNITANVVGLATPMLPPFVKIDLLMAAVQDLKINGDNNSAISFTGVSFAGEQVELSGSGDINGQVISFSNTHVSGSPVVSNNISGSFDLTLNDGNSVGRIKLFSWRQIKR